MTQERSDLYVVEVSGWIITSLALCLMISSPAIGLIAGFAVALCLGMRPRHIPQRLGNSSLKLAVICLGAGLKLDTVLRVGYHSLGVTFTSILLTLLIGALLGRLWRVDAKVTTLVSGGTAICGGSAIAALAPSISATQAQTAVALLIIFSLNAIALLIFPPLGHALELSEESFGLWTALAVHDTSSVVGAAAIYGGSALAIATTVKLTRALWILPLSLGSARLYRAESGARVPWFLFGFLGVAAARAILEGAPLVDAGFAWVALGGKRLMVGTLFLIGASLRARDLREIGLRPMLMAITLWTLVSASSLWLILNGWIQAPPL